MSYEDMIRADPIPATEPVPSFVTPDEEPSLFIESAAEPKIRARPERLMAEPSLWRVHLESREGRVLAGLAGKEQGHVDPAALRRAAPDMPASERYCPPWLSTVFFPRVAPRRIEAPGSLAGDAAGGAVRDIVEQLSRDWPWCTIGRVFFSAQGTNFARNHSGSGVLVGRNLLLTASHLVPWGQPSGGWWMEFVPAYNLGVAKDGKTEPFGSSYVESAHGVANFDNSVDGLDCAICKLYTPLGDRCGWIGSHSWSGEDPYYAGEWTSVGYPDTDAGGGGEIPVVQFARGIKDIDNDGDGLALETVRFTDHGWSGGPLWGWIDVGPRVIGVCSGEEYNLGPDRSVFAGGEHMVNLVKYGLANYA
jgi:hypothetical protein